MTGQVVVVTEHITGSELVESPTALYPSTSLYPSEELIPGGGLLYPSETTLPSATLYPLGASLLEVTDLSEFDQDGGQVQIGTETHYYEVLADGTQADGSGFLQLNDSLTGSYRAGEPVYEYPRIVERWADVLEPNGEEVLRVRVPHSLYDKLALGIREDEAGEMVTFAGDGTDTVITDILGKFPIQDLSSVLLTTSPDGTGQRVEIDDEGIREIGDDETIDVSLTPANGLRFTADDGSLISQRFIEWTVDGVPFFHIEAIDSTFSDQLQLRAEAANSTKDGRLFVLASDSAAKQAYLELRAQRSSVATRKRDFRITLDPDGGGVGVTKTIWGSDGYSDWLLDDAWQDWTPTLTGWSADPTNSIYRYRKLGKLVVVSIRQTTAGTSNATTKSITAPVAAATITNMIWAATCSATDNGTDLAASSQVSIASGSSTINFAKDLSTITGGWTAAGGHKIKYCTLIYESAA